MLPAQAQDAYRRAATQATTLPPEKLIHLLYERVLKHLRWAGEGIAEKNPQKRGENLGKAIAIVTELNASLDMEKGGEAATFLRGLYEAILIELPKVAVSNDIEVVKRAYRYLKKLKETWEQTAMQEATRVARPTRPATTGVATPQQVARQKEPLVAPLERQGKRLSMSV